MPEIRELLDESLKNKHTAVNIQLSTTSADWHISHTHTNIYTYIIISYFQYLTSIVVWPSLHKHHSKYSDWILFSDFSRGEPAFLAQIQLHGCDLSYTCSLPKQLQIQLQLLLHQKRTTFPTETGFPTPLPSKIRFSLKVKPERRASGTRRWWSAPSHSWSHPAEEMLGWPQKLTCNQLYNTKAEKDNNINQEILYRNFFFFYYFLTNTT